MIGFRRSAVNRIGEIAESIDDAPGIRCPGILFFVIVPSRFWRILQKFFQTIGKGFGIVRLSPNSEIVFVDLGSERTFSRSCETGESKLNRCIEHAACRSELTAVGEEEEVGGGKKKLHLFFGYMFAKPVTTVGNVVSDGPLFVKGGWAFASRLFFTGDEEMDLRKGREDIEDEIEVFAVSKMSELEEKRNFGRKGRFFPGFLFRDVAARKAIGAVWNHFGSDRLCSAGFQNDIFVEKSDIENGVSGLI